MKIKKESYEDIIYSLHGNRVFTFVAIALLIWALISTDDHFFIYTLIFFLYIRIENHLIRNRLEIRLTVY